jgi:hypothetical protein
MFAGSWRTNRALESYRQLLEVVDELTEEEVYYCLKLETETQRRKTIIDRLIARAAELNKQQFIKSLKEKINGIDPE